MLLTIAEESIPQLNEVAILTSLLILNLQESKKRYLNLASSVAITLAESLRQNKLI